MDNDASSTDSLWICSVDIIRLSEHVVIDNAIRCLIPNLNAELVNTAITADRTISGRQQEPIVACPVDRAS